MRLGSPVGHGLADAQNSYGVDRPLLVESPELVSEVFSTEPLFYDWQKENLPEIDPSIGANLAIQKTVISWGKEKNKSTGTIG